MRKWMVVAGAVAAIVVVFLVARGGRRPPSGQPASPPAAGAPGAPRPHGDAGAAGPSAAPGGEPQQPDGATYQHPPTPPPTPTAEELQVLRNINEYPVTLARVETYAAAVREIRAAGEKDPALMARLRAPKPPAHKQAELAAWLEAIAPLKAILSRHGLTGMDLILMPQAVLAGQAALAREEGGEKVPPGETNPSSLALHRAEPRKIDALTRAFRADLAGINGP